MHTEHIQIDLNPPISGKGYALYNVGVNNVHSDISVPEHYHNICYELTVVLEGEGYSFTKQVATHIEKGDIYVSFPYEKHKLLPLQGTNMRICFITFTAESKNYKSSLESIWSDNLPPSNRVFRNQYVPTLIMSIIDEFSGGLNSCSSDLISSIINQIVIYVLKAFDERVPHALSKNSSNIELCHHIEHVIDTRIFVIKNLKEVAKALSYNYCYMINMYKKTTGTNLADYYSARRLDIAKDLIKKNDLSLTEIAEKLNYSSMSSFSNAFKSQYGMSPKQYEISICEKS